MEQVLVVVEQEQQVATPQLVMGVMVEKAYITEIRLELV
jgi:hypothetical protein